MTTGRNNQITTFSPVTHKRASITEILRGRPNFPAVNKGYSTFFLLRFLRTLLLFSTEDRAPKRLSSSRESLRLPFAIFWSLTNLIRLERDFSMLSECFPYGIVSPQCR